MRCRNKMKKRHPIPVMSWILVGLALMGMISGGVVAYLSASTAPVTNTFTADAPLAPTVAEDFQNNVKTNVKVSVADMAEPGYMVYVRAAIVATWKNPQNGNILPQAPVAGTDYTLDVNSTDWFYKDADGFYYHKTMVKDGEDTSVLINSCSPITAKDGYVLNVEIMAQTIQALGTTDADGTPAVKDAWNVSVAEDGTLKP